MSTSRTQYRAAANVAATAAMMMGFGVVMALPAYAATPAGAPESACQHAPPVAVSPLPGNNAPVAPQNPPPSWPAQPGQPPIVPPGSPTIVVPPIVINPPGNTGVPPTTTTVLPTTTTVPPPTTTSEVPPPPPPPPAPVPGLWSGPRSDVGVGVTQASDPCAGQISQPAVPSLVQAGAGTSASDQHVAGGVLLGLGSLALLCAGVVGFVRRRSTL
ncbi:hypothetical protein [Rhodococcus sp. APC 3903]|uniref:hypothetical protein n=1 Tax=Rhodococcus sp. APC 3903 TaxID=3035193 RepID=UPI0025B3F642|nr:hypothetical protein [Rhodococcus sp. APC 3903]MDN3460684.1 hypothetical protein [Rhodococcus sp. APC 3903]